MQTWCIPVVAVSVVTLTILFILSFDTLEYQEIGLNYSWISESVEEKTYRSGRYYLGLGNHFLKFPQIVKSVFFLDEQSAQTQGPSLQSRTRDGLNVWLEVSFQYRLKPDKLWELYSMLGADYEQVLVRMAMEALTTAATLHNAHVFFNDRTLISEEMHTKLQQHFEANAFADVPFFQLRTVHLPEEFELAIQDTQVKEQEIQIAEAEQQQNRVAYETRVIQAEQAVKVMANQAAAEATSIILKNDAYCSQYQITQNLQQIALQDLAGSTGWNPTEVLEYLRIRAVREHPGDKTTMRV